MTEPPKLSLPEFIAAWFIAGFAWVGLSLIAASGLAPDSVDEETK